MKFKRPFNIFALLYCVLLVSCSRDDISIPIVNPESYGKANLEKRDFENKTILINYWAEWCKPCIEEIPELNLFYRLHKSHVIVMGVNFDGLGEKKLKQALTKADIEFPVLEKNPDDFFSLPVVEVLPTTLVLNTKGQVIHELKGPQTNHSLQQLMVE